MPNVAGKCVTYRGKLLHPAGQLAHGFALALKVWWMHEVDP